MSLIFNVFAKGAWRSEGHKMFLHGATCLHENVTWMPNFLSWVPRLLRPPRGSKKHETHPTRGLGLRLMWERSLSLAFPVTAALVSIRRLMVHVHADVQVIISGCAQKARNDRLTRTGLGQKKVVPRLGESCPVLRAILSTRSCLLTARGKLTTQQPIWAQPRSSLISYCRIICIRRRLRWHSIRCHGNWWH